MDIIKIKFVDMHKGFDINNNDFVRILSKKYKVIFSDSPNYLFYSCFGYEHLKYDCIRIFFTGECYTPDFNDCDYAIGFDYLEFGDRYLRVPLFKMFQYRQEYLSLVSFNSISIDVIRKKENFCGFVYSNIFADDARKRIFDVLNTYKTVSSGGKYMNNMGGPVEDKIQFLRTCKFSIAFENTYYPGYTTEKIVDSFYAGTVPIYYGNKFVVRDFNPSSFINCNDYDSFDEILEIVKRLDQDESEYMKILNQPKLMNPLDDKLEDFLFYIVEQGENNAKRRPDSFHTLKKLRAAKRHGFFEDHIYEKYARAKRGIVRLSNKAF